MEPPARVQEAHLQRFMHWAHANGVQFRGSKIKHSEGLSEGLGVFSANDCTEGVLMVTPLDLAITPMRVLQDHEFGNVYGKLFEDGDVDDRLLMILFLLVERVRGELSFWAPYLDMLPTSFGTPLWFTEQELEELKGTALYHATKLQLKNLKALFAQKVKPFAENLLSMTGVERREIEFQDFLWANCIFWTRALNIPCPTLFVFPKQLQPSVNVDDSCQGQEQPLSECCTIRQDQPESEVKDNNIMQKQPPQQTMLEKLDDVEFLESKHSGSCICNEGRDESIDRGVGDNHECADGTELVYNKTVVCNEKERTSVWVEGLVPGIDFCNHDPKGVVQWEVDGNEGSATGLPNSMYLTTDATIPADKEILISYGNKGNEELLFLYGFVVEDNPDDYLMLHFPKEALDQDACAEAKIQLLNQQNLSLRWLFPAALLQRGFYAEERPVLLSRQELCEPLAPSSYSWSGNRKPPTYLNQFVFPEEAIAALRVVAMKEDEVKVVQSLLQELSQSGFQRSTSGEDVRAAVWEVCGNAGALQLLTDLLASRMLDLEEGSGPEQSDKEILERHSRALVQNPSLSSHGQENLTDPNWFLPENAHACVIYRKGQKYLAKSFLKESEHCLDLCILEAQFGGEINKLN